MSPFSVAFQTKVFKISFHCAPFQKFVFLSYSMERLGKSRREDGHAFALAFIVLSSFSFPGFGTELEDAS